MKPTTQPLVESAGSEHVRVREMDSDALGKYVAEQTVRVFQRLEELRPLYEELWKRFGQVGKGETILGCRTRTEYAEKILHKSMRSIQFALYGRRPLKSGSAKKIQCVIKDFVPAQFVTEELRRAAKIEEEDERPEEIPEIRIPPRVPPRTIPPPILTRFTPPNEDIREFASLGRRAAASKYHPDRGDSSGRMAQLNQVADWLESLAVQS